MKCADCGLEILEGEAHFISANKFPVHERNVWGWSELCISRLKSAIAERDAELASNKNILDHYQSRFGQIANAWRDGNNDAVLDAVRKHVTATDCDNANSLLARAKSAEKRIAELLPLLQKAVGLLEEAVTNEVTKVSLIDPPSKDKGAQ